MAVHRLALSVPATPHAVTVARHQAVDGIRDWDAELDDEVLHTAALLISELLANAVQHAGAGRIRLTSHLTATALRIEVSDSSSLLPLPGLPDEDAESGRGLLLVAALADRHGVEPTPTGKRCWAEISRPAPPKTATADSLPLEPGNAATGAVRLRRGYWCECWTETVRGSTDGPVLVASFDAYTASQADRWVSVTLRVISSALDADASDAAWAWLYDDRIETRRALLRREPCTVTIRHANTRITWAIRPVLHLPLAHSEAATHPASADTSRPRSSA